MKASEYSPLNTSSLKDGSTLLDRIQGFIKVAMDKLANRILGNVTEENGIWTITGGKVAPVAQGSTALQRPPTGSYYFFVDPADNKLKYVGAKGTITTVAVP